MTVYNVPKVWLVFHPGILLAALLCAASVLILLPPWLFLLGWRWYPLSALLIFGAMWWLARIIMGVPYRIVLTDDRTLLLTSVNREEVVPAGQIVSVKSIPLTLGLVSLKHAKGRVLILSDYDRWHVLIGALASVNPRIQIKGFRLDSAKEVK